MIQILVGVNVIDRDLYTEYRARMMPLLEAHGGSFGVDVWVAEVLRAPGEEPFNRLFTIQFDLLEQMEAFFANPEYLRVRRAYFDPGVSSVTQFGRYAPL